MERATRLIKYWAPVIAYGVLIFFLSSQSDTQPYLPDIFSSMNDKVLHGIEYGILGVLCYRAFRHAAGKNAPQFGIPLAIVAATAFGLVDEFHQSFVAFRHSEGLDLFADAVGATVAVLCWYTFHSFRRSLQKSHEFERSAFTTLNR